MRNGRCSLYRDWVMWEKAPKTPRPGAPVRAFLQVVAAGLLLSNHQAWWAWAFFIAVIAIGVRETLQWVRDDRVYRAWVAWDEAGGPDASPEIRTK